MHLVRWEPFRELVNMKQAMDRLFEDGFARPWHLWSDLGIGEFPIDMYQTANEVVVKATLPGVRTEDVDISITGDILTIKREHKEEHEVKEKDYLRRECRYGTFSRSVTLPAQVRADKAGAIFENGILTLTLPKAEEIKSKQIKVKAKQIAEGKKAESKN